MENAMQATSPSEADLWGATVGALRTALAARKPDAIASWRLHMTRLDDEISGLVNRREIVARSRASDQKHISFQGAVNEFELWKRGDALVDALTSQIDMLAARMKDLAGLAQYVKSSPLDHDAGPTPQVIARAKEEITGDGECTGRYSSLDPGTDDLSDELKRAAMDIQHGWAVMTKKATWALGGRTPGDAESGMKELKLAEQYYHWVNALHRKRMSTWAIDDVVCEGLSRSESATKRRCDPVKVYGELVAGLTLYAETFEPLSEVG
jgi:hypothetical protein